MIPHSLPPSCRESYSFFFFANKPRRGDALILKVSIQSSDGLLDIRISFYRDKVRGSNLHYCKRQQIAWLLGRLDREIEAVFLDGDPETLKAEICISRIRTLHIPGRLKTESLTND